MNQKIVSQLDHEGYFTNPTIADESPLEPGVFLLPAGAVDFPPPAVPAGKRALWNGSGFVFEAIPQPEPLPEPTPEQIAEAVRNARQIAYMKEADPIFFMSQRGEATQEEWLAKVAEIKERFPDGVIPTFA